MLSLLGSLFTYVTYTTAITPQPKLKKKPAGETGGLSYKTSNVYLGSSSRRIFPSSYILRVRLVIHTTQPWKHIKIAAMIGGM